MVIFSDSSRCRRFYVLISVRTFHRRAFISHVLKHFPRLFAWSVLAYGNIISTEYSFESFIRVNMGDSTFDNLLGFIPDLTASSFLLCIGMDRSILRFISLEYRSDGHGLVPLLAISRRFFR